MPDQFGFETVREVNQRMRAERAARSQQAIQSGSEGIQAGQALANIFGGTIRKTLETRGARKTEAERLVSETGMSQVEAREQAKQNISRDFNQVRRAKQIQTAQQASASIVQKLTPIVGAAEAQATAMIDIAAKLRAIPGLETEATRLTIEAGKIREAEELRKLNLSKLKADLRSTEVSTEKTEEEIEQVGKTGIGKLLDEREVLIANIDDSEDADEIRAFEAELKITNQKIAKEVFITGTSDTDAQFNPGALQKKTLSDLEASLLEGGNQMDLLTSIGETFKPEFLTYMGQGGARLLELAEKGGIPLSRAGKKFLGDFAAFKRNSLDGLNRYIKLITGAQMSEAEASRLRKAFPDVEKDGPTTYMSKYVEVIRQVMAVRARAQHALATGELGVLPGDFKDGFGNDLSEFMPTNDEAREFLGLEVAEVPRSDVAEVDTTVPDQLPRDAAVDDSLLLIQQLLETAENASPDGS